MADISFGHNIIGSNGRILRIGIDRPKRERDANEGPWLVQFWVIRRPDQKTYGHFILLSPDDLREGLQNRTYDGIQELGKASELLVSGVGTPIISVQKQYPASVGDSVAVDAAELRKWIEEILRRIDAEG